MPFNVTEQIQEAMERGDFDNLPGKGKPLKFESNPFLRQEVRVVNQMLKDKGFAPRWIELDKEIQNESKRLKKQLVTIKERRERLAEIIRLQPIKRKGLQQTFELEQARALETYCNLLRQLNEMIRHFNLIVPIAGKQQQLYNLDAAIDHFHEECPGL